MIKLFLILTNFSLIIIVIMQEDKEVNHGIIVHLQTAYLSMISELEQIQEEKRYLIINLELSYLIEIHH